MQLTVLNALDVTLILPVFQTYINLNRQHHLYYKLIIFSHKIISTTFNIFNADLN